MRTMRFLREMAGMTQTELAGLIGTVQPVIADWEAGRRSLRRDRAKAAAALLRRRSRFPVRSDELELDTEVYLARLISSGKPWGKIGNE